MHFLLLKASAVILTFTLCSNILVSEPLTAANCAQAAVPSGWRKIDADGKFSFYLPPDMRDTGRSSLENFHREYTNGRMQVRFDFDPYERLAYSNRARTFGNDFQEMQLQVDGKKSFMFVYQRPDRNNRRRYNVDLNIGDLPNGEVILYRCDQQLCAGYRNCKNYLQHNKNSGIITAPCDAS
jgi:hypothetical protein